MIGFRTAFRKQSIRRIAMTTATFVVSLSLVGLPATAQTGTTQSTPTVTEETSITRRSQRSATQIVERAVEVKTRVEVTNTRNSTTSSVNRNLGTKILRRTSDTTVTQSVTVQTDRKRNSTTVTTTTRTTKEQRFPKSTAKGIAFTFAMGSPGISGVLIKESIDRLNFKTGTRGVFQEIANSDLVVAGAASGQFQMGSSTTSAVMKVIQEGANLRFIGENSRNQWTLVAKAGISNCADMNNRRLALHSAGGVSTALYRAWARKNCPATSRPLEQFIAGSPNRLVALLADRIDVTMMEVEDTLSLPATGYQIVSNFSRDLPEIKTGLVYVNGDFLQKNPQIAAGFVYELTRLSAELNQDPKAFKRLVEKHAPGYANLDAIIAAYQKAKLFPEDPGSFFKDLETSAAFYAAGGTLKPGLRANQMATLQPLREALQLLAVK